MAKDKPLGMIHFDAHTDFFSSYFGDYKYTHETRFCRAVEKGFLDPKKVLQTAFVAGARILKILISRSPTASAPLRSKSCSSIAWKMPWPRGATSSARTEATFLSI